METKDTFKLHKHFFTQSKNQLAWDEEMREYRRLNRTPEYENLLPQNGKAKDYSIWEIYLKKPLICTSASVRNISAANQLRNHLERYQRDWPGQGNRQNDAFGHFIANHGIYTIKHFVDAGGTIQLLEDGLKKSEQNKIEKFLITQLMENNHNDTKRYWNRRKG